MSDPEETLEWLESMFDKHNDEYLGFEKIPEEARKHPRPDLCAFIYLH